MRRDRPHSAADAVSVPSAASRILVESLSTIRSAFAFRSHSQTVMTVQPAVSRAAVFRLSLSTFPSNFSCQNAVLVEGVVAFRQPSCRCRSSRGRRSRCGISVERYQACRAGLWREAGTGSPHGAAASGAAFRGPVSRPLIRDMFQLRRSAEIVSAITGHPARREEPSRQYPQSVWRAAAALRCRPDGTAPAAGLRRNSCPGTSEAAPPRAPSGLRHCAGS